jgi:hypothetical protein
MQHGKPCKLSGQDTQKSAKTTYNQLFCFEALTQIREKEGGY